MNFIALIGLILLGVSMAVWYLAVLLRSAFIDQASSGYKIVDIVFYSSLLAAWIIPGMALMLVFALYTSKEYKYALLATAAAFVLMAAIAWVNLYVTDSLRKHYQDTDVAELEESYQNASRDFTSPSGVDFIQLVGTDVNYWNVNEYHDGRTIKRVLGHLNADGGFEMPIPPKEEDWDWGDYWWSYYHILPPEQFDYYMSLTDATGKTFGEVHQPEKWTVFLGSASYPDTRELFPGYDGSVSISVYAEYYEGGEKMRLHVAGSYQFYQIYYNADKENEDIAFEFVRGADGLYDPVEPLSAGEIEYLKKIDKQGMRNSTNYKEFSLTSVIDFPSE